jgi:hypothetical protein
MGHVTNYPFTFVGILLLFVGWFSVISGIFGFFRAEDLLILTFRIESMVVDTTFVPESQIFIHMLIRIFFGFIIIFFGNLFLVRGLDKTHSFMHPRFDDFRRLR